MSKAEAFAYALRHYRLVAILRGTDPSQLAELVAALAESGVRLVEVALSDSNAIEQVGILRRCAPEGVLIGAGTVTNVQLAQAALNQGAEFLVTPGVEIDVIRFAEEHDLGLLCGALTPTEISQARASGACFIKLFPASVMGAGYVKALLGPYPELNVIVVGGIGSTNLREYLEAGALGAGVGGALTASTRNDPDFQEARREARSLVSILTRTR